MSEAIKTDNGIEFPAAAYAYVPDAADPSTWKLRLWADLDAKATREQLGATAAALSPGGFRGEKADIPAADLARVKARIRAAYQKLGVADDEMPAGVRLSEGPQFVIFLGSLVLTENGQTRIPIAKLGTFYKGKLKFSITADDVASLADNFGKRGNGEVVIDYEHASEAPEVANGGPVPAAGWITSIEAKPDAAGIVWGTANFNERARQMIDAREYKYGSPALNWGARDKSNGDQQGLTLTSYALTNTPFLDGMPAIRLSDAAWSETKGENERVAKEKIMCSEHPKTQMLCPQCDKDEITGLNASEHTHQGPKVIQLSEVKRDGKGRLDLSSLSNDAVVSFAVIRAADAERLALSEVQAAVTKGIVLPAQREHFEKLALSDIESFRGIVATMKPQVDLTEHGIAGTGAEGKTKTELQKLDLRLSEMATTRAEKDKVSPSEALKRVARDNPDIERQRTELLRLVEKGGE
ncbi:MAG TPA: phage protease [Acidobacteriaceae bacterium]|jgi:phage I-like protein|nr:phage protease [Acidobacteriaceae bacterium]